MGAKKNRKKRDEENDSAINIDEKAHRVQAAFGVVDYSVLFPHLFSVIPSNFLYRNT